MRQNKVWHPGKNVIKNDRTNLPDVARNEELLLKAPGASNAAPNLLENCEQKRLSNLLPKRAEPVSFINNNFLFCVKHTQSPIETNFLTQEFLMGSNSNTKSQSNNDLSSESLSVPK